MAIVSATLTGSQPRLHQPMNRQTDATIQCAVCGDTPDAPLRSASKVRKITRD
jgi:hypothetical protein